MGLGGRRGSTEGSQSSTHRHHEPNFRKIKNGGKEWIKEERGWGQGG